MWGRAPKREGSSMHPADSQDTRCDVLFAGEQTAHVVRLIRGITGRGLRPVVLNGPRLVQTLSGEAGLEVPLERCTAPRLPGRHRCRWVRGLEGLVQRRRLCRLLDRLRPGVVHINGAYPEHELFVDLPERAPLVVTCWGTDINAGLAHGPPARRRAVVRLLDRARVVTADSREMLQRVRAVSARPMDLRLILWGIDAERFAGATDTTAAQWRRELELPCAADVVLAPRRIDPRYSPERVLRAFALSRAGARPAGHLVFKLFGDNPQCEHRQRAMLEELAGELGVRPRIRFARPCRYDELPGLYRLAGCAVFLLSRDGCPSTAFELMAAGVPLVAGRTAGYEGLLCHGENALLVDPQDAAAAARHIDQALERTADITGLVQRARVWVRQQASADATIDAFLDTYRTAARAVQRPAPALAGLPRPHIGAEGHAV